MTMGLTQRMCVTLIGVAILSSCSHPIAYFQRGSIEPGNQLNTQPVAISTPTQAISTQIEPVSQVKEAIKQIEAYARNDSKLGTDKNWAGAWIG